MLGFQTVGLCASTRGVGTGIEVETGLESRPPVAPWTIGGRKVNSNTEGDRKAPLNQGAADACIIGARWIWDTPKGSHWMSIRRSSRGISSSPHKTAQSNARIAYSLPRRVTLLISTWLIAEDNNVYLA